MMLTVQALGHFYCSKGRKQGVLGMAQRGGGVPPRAVPLFCAIWGGGGGSPPVPKRRAIFRKVACLGWRATFSPTLFLGSAFFVEEVSFVSFFGYAIF